MKFAQITFGTDGQGNAVLFGLDEVGQIWRHEWPTAAASNLSAEDWRLFPSPVAADKQTFRVNERHSGERCSEDGEVCDHLVPMDRPCGLCTARHSAALRKSA